MKKLEVLVAAALGAAAMWMVAHVFGMDRGWSLMLALCAATGTAFISYRPMEIWETLSSEYAKVKGQFSVRSKKLRAYMKFVWISEGQKEFFKRRYEDLLWAGRLLIRISGAALLIALFCLGGGWLSWLFMLFGLEIESPAFFVYAFITCVGEVAIVVSFGWLCEKANIKTRLKKEDLKAPDSPPRTKKKKDSTGKLWDAFHIYLCFCVAATMWPLLATAITLYCSYVALVVSIEASRLLCVVILNTLIACASFERTSAVGGAVLGGGTSILIFGSSSPMSLLASMALGAASGYGILKFRLWRAKKSPNGDPYFAFFNT